MGDLKGWCLGSGTGLGGGGGGGGGKSLVM